MADMSERLSPATTGGIPQKFEARVIEPPVKPGSGRGSGTGVPGTGTSLTPDHQPQPRKSHKVRNWIMAATASLGGAGAFVATRSGNEPATSTVPVVTTVEANPTSPTEPVTVPSSTPTTAESPTTTLEPKPTDVVEHRNGYDVLRNGGFLYPVDSITIDGAEIDTSEFGGFQLHMKDGTNAYGFTEKLIDGEAPQDVLLRNMLWTFGAQHPEFINPEGGVDVKAYAEYLSQNNWTDTVYLPDNISEPNEHAKYPPIVKSTPLTMDFSKPIVLSSGDLGQVDGLEPFEGYYDYYDPTPADDARNLVGISADGQFFFSYHSLKVSTGEVRSLPLDESLSPFTNNFGYILSEIAAITTTQPDPQTQWFAASMTYAVPAGKITPDQVPGTGYESLSKTVLPMSDFIDPKVGGSKLFSKTS
ncbi:MAG: hypothetical protein WBB49_01315 [Microgenomates group bacterium]